MPTIKRKRFFWETSVERSELRRNNFMNPRIGISGIIVSIINFAFSCAVPAQAQAIDASKITCEDFIFYRLSNPNAITYWLSGYYHGKHDNPVVDPDNIQANADKMRTYCEQQKNYKVTLMEAIEQMSSTDK
jgi:hypothetical protein